jgi:hypothetical protein
MSKTEIICRPSCGNAPRKEFLNSINTAFATGDADFIIKHASKDIIWFIHGDKIIRGIEEFSDEIRRLSANKADKLIIESIITHGREASLSGAIIMGGKTYVFSDVYHFTSTKGNTLSKIHSYTLESNLEGI